jgi:CRP-like cAMP-binding protein
VFREGEPANAFYIISAGLVSIEVTTAGGERVTLTLLGPGDCFGEVALLDERAGYRTASAYALEPCTLHLLAKHDFDELRRAHPSVERVLIDVLRARVMRLSDHLVDTLTGDARTKVLRTLCRLADIFDVAHGKPIRVTLDRVKSMAGVTRRVTDIVAELEAMGLVKRAPGHTIHVPDLAALRREAGFVA